MFMIACAVFGLWLRIPGVHWKKKEAGLCKLYSMNICDDYYFLNSACVCIGAEVCLVQLFYL